jgi:phosphate starvation-inducible PhoH-like protein
MARPESARASVTDVKTADVEVSDPAVLLRLSGPSGDYLRAIANELRVAMGMRGDVIRIQGSAQAVALAERVLAELSDVLAEGGMSEPEISRAVRTLRAHPDVRLRDLKNDVVVTTAGRRIVAPKGVAQQEYINAIRNQDVVFGIGPAGTGKTYLAMAMAVRALVDKRVKRIVLTRPAVEAGERLGFLPGDLAEKINPYLRPLYDALNDMMDPEKVQQLQLNGVIEVAPLAFMRGRTLNDSFIVLDEAQNTTAEQMKMFLTRLGFGSQAVITGDVTQVDLPTGQRSGLDDAARLLEGIEGVRFIYFSEADVVRHPLVQRIVRAYDSRDVERKIRRERRIRGQDVGGGREPIGESGERDDEQ